MPRREPRTDDERQIFGVLDRIAEAAHLYGIKAFIVGGFCRDDYWGKPHTLDSDIDIMAENYEGLNLAGFLASHFGVPIEFHHRSGTATLEIDGLSFDFKANLKNYDLLPEIRKFNLKQDNFTFDVLTRDFTINTLVMSLDSWKMYDITGLAKHDLDHGIIRTPVDAEKAIASNPINVLRAIKFATRYDFEIVPELQQAMHKYAPLVWKQLSADKINDMINEILESNHERGSALLSEFGITEEDSEPTPLN